MTKELIELNFWNQDWKKHQVSFSLTCLTSLYLLILPIFCSSKKWLIYFLARKCILFNWITDHPPIVSQWYQEIFRGLPIERHCARAKGSQNSFKELRKSLFSHLPDDLITVSFTGGYSKCLIINYELAYSFSFLFSHYFHNSGQNEARVMIVSMSLPEITVFWLFSQFLYWLCNWYMLMTFVVHNCMYCGNATE